MVCLRRSTVQGINTSLCERDFLFSVFFLSCVNTVKVAKGRMSILSEGWWWRISCYGRMREVSGLLCECQPQKWSMQAQTIQRIAASVCRYIYMYAGCLEADVVFLVNSSSKNEKERILTLVHGIAVRLHAVKYMNLHFIYSRLHYSLLNHVGLI